MKERWCGPVDIIDGSFVADNMEAQNYRRFRRDHQHDPNVEKYWNQHNQEIKESFKGKKARHGNINL